MNEIISNNKDIMEVGVANLNVYASHKTFETIQNIYKNAQPEDLRKLIAKHLMPTIEEMKKNAEIPTPVSLVDEMLEKIPTEFWTKPKTVLEPCCGKGNFVLGIFDKLYNGLQEDDKVERCRIIIEECLYYGDITALNVFITTEILKCHIKSKTGQKEVDYKFNSYVGDTLDANFENAFKIKKFDAVIGNPPYQHTDENGRKALNHNLWSSFITELFKLINQDGYLLFVTPNSWMSPTSKTKEVFYDNYIVYLNINECEKHFNVGSKFSYYLIQKTQKKEKTVVMCLYNKIKYNSKILITDFTFLPNLLCDKSLSILQKFYHNKFEKVSFNKNFELHSSTKKNNIRNVMDKEFIYPIRHTTKNNIRYSDKKHSLSDKNKILLNLSGNLKPVYDDGKLGFTEAQMYLITDNSNFVGVINSKMYSFIFNICKWSGFNIDKIFHDIPYIREDFIDDNQIYKLFNITEDEKLLIETIV
jgi:SAM-dependent methyltransferase